MGMGEEMKRWAFAVEAKPTATRAAVAALKNMLALLNECVRNVDEVEMLQRC